MKISAIISFLICITANGADLSVKGLVDHFNHDGDLGRKSGTNKRTNEFRGYLVSIEADSLFASSDQLYVYKSTLGTSDGIIPIGLKRTPEFQLEFDSAAAMEKELQGYNQRLAREGGGDPNFFKTKQRVRMWVIAKPAGFAKYVHPSGPIDSALAFDVIKVCKRDFKKCRSIRDEADLKVGPTILQRLFGE